MPVHNTFIKRESIQDRVFGVLITLSYLFCSLIGLYQGDYKVFWLFLALTACCFILLDLQSLCTSLWKNWKKKKSR